MISVADVARELDRPEAEVLDACGDLDIVARTTHSGLSSTEHARLRSHFGGDDATLGAVPRGSTDADPHADTHVPPAGGIGDLDTWEQIRADRRSRPEPAPDSVRLPFHQRISPRTVVRGSVLLFGVIAIGFALIGLNRSAELAGETPAGESPAGRAGAEGGTTPTTAPVCADFDDAGGTVVADCAGPHDAEIVSRLTIDGGDDDAHPGEAALLAEAGERCPDVAEVSRGAEGLAPVYLVPTASSWAAGDRTVLCLVEDPSAPLVGSVTGR